MPSLNAGILSGLEREIPRVVHNRWLQLERQNAREGTISPTTDFNKDLAKQISVGPFPHTWNGSCERYRQVMLRVENSYVSKQGGHSACFSLAESVCALQGDLDNHYSTRILEPPQMISQYKWNVVISDVIATDKEGDIVSDSGPLAGLAGQIRGEWHELRGLPDALSWSI